LCPRFPTWLGKNEGIKKWMALKNRRRSCSRFATNLGNQELMRSSEREKKGVLKTANLGERDRNHSCPCPRPTWLHTLIWPNTVSSCPTRSLSTSPTRRGPTWCGPTRQHGTVIWTGFLLSELLVRVLEKGLRKTEEKLRSWGKLSTTKDPGAWK
jgi:hypothetical protein